MIGGRGWCRGARVTAEVMLMSLLLDQGVPVGGAALDLLDPVKGAGIVENALGQGGLARIHAGGHTDTAQVRQRLLAH